MPVSSAKRAVKPVARPVAKPASRPAGKKAVKAAKAPDLGALPEWNLADLYPAIDSPDIRRDLDRGETECIAF